MAQTMAMGHACGTAAALSLEADIAPIEINTVSLQTKLREQGAVLEMPDNGADISASGWANNF
jgi:hypothetical protein